ncbi:MAG TPA: glycoside hydrolase family 44 protein, partial [Bryobacteraceae bacterium]|nr:glycoside hydrolase family 44 protein [Bryobacteraceae bacterium]
MRTSLGIFFLTSLAAFAQQPGPALSIDATANLHPISPDVYGIDFYWTLPNAGDPTLPAAMAAASNIRATARRWGGDSETSYSWKFDVNNLANDWFFQVLTDSSVDASKLPAGSTFNAFADQVRITGGKAIGTIPILPWSPKARMEMCSFDVSKYGKQCKQDPYAQYHTVTCGDGVVYDDACGDPSVADGKFPTNPVYIQNDPSDAYAPADQNFQAEWITYLISRYGQANQGGIAIWSMDNEPIWWDDVHRDIHPDPYSYDELASLNLKYAAAIKQADPTALVSGPVSDNWSSLWFSKKDILAGQALGNYWSNPVDRKAHGNVPLMAWYLQQFQKYEQQHGVRLLDYLDQHAYLAPGSVGFASAGDSSNQALRLQYTRVFWDPTFVVSGDYWIQDVENGGGPIAPAFIPRLQAIIAQNYPGTKLALTEYNFGALDDINGALAQADLLGIFGYQGLDAAALWGPPTPTDPGAYAFKIYRNYDGIGGTFGETSAKSTSADQGQLSVYGALRSDGNLTAMVINKTGQDLSSALTLANFSAGSTAEVWRYSSANLNAIVAQASVSVGAGQISTVFPANSITLLIVPPATLAGPKPKITDVTSAASYGHVYAPGQMVVVWGNGLGPAEIAALRLDSNGLVSTSVAGVRILFDGIPAPIVYATATQCSAVIPYFGATNATTHVQVEYNGVRSDPFQIAVIPTAPGLFTADSSGKGPAAVSNSPAHPGSVVTLWAT